MDDFNCTKGIPSSDFCMSALLKHASLVYTHTLFRDFEDEFKYAMASDIENLYAEGNNFIYRVCLNSIIGSDQRVYFNKLDSIVYCECKNFNESGWLCFHCIRVLHAHSYKQIPKKYISTRWTRLAKKEVWEKYDKEKREKGEINNFTPWRLHMIRRYYNLIIKSHKLEEARKVIKESFRKASITVENIIKKEEAKQLAAAKQAAEKEANEVVQQANKDDSNQQIQQASSFTKGKDNKRIKGHYDSYKKPSKRGKKRHKEFGSKTPKVHLF
ncbi:Protein FAR1-RELATED SEQUENCE 4 [Bienertia sinuspersici]